MTWHLLCPMGTVSLIEAHLMGSGSFGRLITAPQYSLELDKRFKDLGRAIIGATLAAEGTTEGSPSHSKAERSVQDECIGQGHQ
jgi:hypothetical protein